MKLNFGIRRIFALSGLILFFSSIALMLIYSDYKSFLQTPVNITEDVVFTIEPSMSFSALNKKLIAANFIDENYYLKILARHSKRAS